VPNSSSQLLIGKWVSDPENETSIARYGSTTLEFTDRGELLYTVHAADTDQIMLLVYRVEGNELVTDQPSQPREERTKYSLRPDGKLSLFSPGRSRLTSGFWRTRKSKTIGRVL
jgi:hypothetical protein